MLRLTLSYPPVTANGLWHVSAHGVHLSPKAAAWKAETIIHIRQTGATTPEGPLHFRMEAHVPDERRRDLDNLIKLTLDSVATALDFDDARVVSIEASKQSGGPARLIVSLWGKG